MLKVWEPFEAMMKPFGTWPNTFAEMARPTWATWKPELPITNVNETEDEIVYTVELPGFGPEEVDVTMKESVLEITGKHEEEGEEEGRKFRRVGNFTRRLLMPTNVNAEAIGAKMENGMLTVVLPKIETPPIEIKKIPVEAQGKEA